MMITSGIKAQYTMGTTGMMNIPTAEMQQTGTFMIGGNYLPEELNPFKYNSGNYFVNITFFSFLELNYRCILLKSDYMAKKPKFNQQDRSLSVRLRPLKEGKYWPAIVIGSNDPFKDKGYNYFKHRSLRLFQLFALYQRLMHERQSQSELVVSVHESSDKGVVYS